MAVSSMSHAAYRKIREWLGELMRLPEERSVTLIKNVVTVCCLQTALLRVGYKYGTEFLY
jgi:hypothetical protein